MRGYAVFIAAILCTAAASTASVRVPAVKCQPDARPLFPDAPDVVWVLNGKAIEKEEFGGKVTPEMVESIRIMCAVDLYHVFGIKTRRGGIIIFTKPGPETALKVSLDSLATLQQTYHAREGTFATSLADLAWSDPSGLITVDLNVADSGDRWTATGAHRYLIHVNGPSSAITVSGSRQER